MPTDVIHSQTTRKSASWKLVEIDAYYSIDDALGDFICYLSGFLYSSY